MTFGDADPILWSDLYLPIAAMVLLVVAAIEARRAATPPEVATRAATWSTSAIPISTGRRAPAYPARPWRPGGSSPRARGRVTQPCAVESATPLISAIVADGFGSPRRVSRPCWRTTSS
ncbi:MAG: hypothetical protein EAS51_12630 [Microbacteriaceae bacterium]|nr:MAG: hypothetical protein EAS51_12630 [Microbacteriaceae bacterium]